MRLRRLTQMTLSLPRQTADETLRSQTYPRFSLLFAIADVMDLPTSVHTDCSPCVRHSGRRGQTQQRHKSDDTGERKCYMFPSPYSSGEASRVR